MAPRLLHLHMRAALTAARVGGLAIDGVGDDGTESSD